MLVRLVAIAATLCLTAAVAPEGALTIRIDGVRSAKGQVRIDVCTQANFLSRDCPYSGFASSQPGTTTVVVRGIPAGRYAVQAYQDENGNHKVDRILFGLPKEGIGFSNDAPIRMSPPKWDAAAFAFDGGAETIRLKLRYFL